MTGSPGGNSKATESMGMGMHKNFNSLRSDQQETYIDQHLRYMDQLSFIAKGVGMAFMLVLAVNFVVYQLVVKDKEVLQMAQAFLMAYAVAAVVFVAMSFKRLFNTMGLAFDPHLG